ncbi:MAG: TonB family protein, partial [Bacteroidota bacterium]
MKRLAFLILSSTISLSAFSQIDTIKNRNQIVSKLGSDTINRDLSDRMPRFPACEALDLDDTEKEKCGREKLLEFIYSELAYPAKAKKRKKKGTVVIGFTVTETGKIEDIQLLRDIGKGCGEEAL